MKTINEDKRPPIVLMDVEDIRLSNMKVDKAEEMPYIVMKGVKDVELENFRGVKNKKMSVAKDLEIGR